VAVIDEIIDYLLYKHSRAIGQGVCLLSGFAIGSAPGYVAWDRLVMAACMLIVAVVAMILMFRNDKPRDYHFENPPEKEHHHD